MVFEDTDGRAEAAWSRRHSMGVANGEEQPGPSGYRVVTVDTPSSSELRDIVSYRRDLEMTKVYADAFATQIQGPRMESSRDPRLGLWSAALTSYGRAFNNGTRHAARVPLDELDESESTFHQFCLDLRNKHVAHAVNGLEDTAVIAYLTDSSFTQRAVTRTGQVHFEQLLSPEEAPAQLSSLCTKLIGVLNKRIRRLHYEVAKELAAMDISEVYALPTFASPKDTPLTTSRRRR
ncbi:hypothetical protein [Curtobacterium sp. MCBA15_012]|uniref:hypothetical protein n=1 Tax=Curtobacterium sp. MCBA15_012 TaxID=1898738 RepID=UPI00091F68C5|nr:hypothetical protein [Curtobacterium sp. MCBA15_012]WIB00331.1 hypothetical protein QOL15_01180 [Curtobacterium sp. MCBA15_012]